MTRCRDMYKFCFAIITTMLIILQFACGKDDDSCHGCGIDTTVKEYSFPVNGRMLADCSGEVAANRNIELKVFYKEDSLVLSSQTDSTGSFSFSYTLLLPGNYAMSAEWESYCLLQVEEDSITFFLTGLSPHSNLDLQLGDSLNIDFYVENVIKPLQLGDTIFYYLEPAIMQLPYTFKVVGPLSGNALVHTIRDKWRFVELDDYDMPVFNHTVVVKREIGGNGSHGYLP